MDKKLLQIIDANYNRAKEAMRVDEDIARFAIKDAKLTGMWKRCRHDLTRALFDLPVSYRRLVESRHSSEDVGRMSFIRDKNSGVRWRDIFIANAKRSQEASRVLEELSKVISPRNAARFQRLRFRLYELEKISLRKL